MEDEELELSHEDYEVDLSDEKGDKKMVPSKKQLFENEVKSRSHHEFQKNISEKWKEISSEDMNSIKKDYMQNTPPLRSKQRTTSTTIPPAADPGKLAGDLILEDIEKRLNAQKKRNQKKSLFSAIFSCFPWKRGSNVYVK